MENMSEHIVYPVFSGNKSCRVIAIESESNGEKFHHLLIYDSEFVQKFTDEAWDFDGTFDSRPHVRDCAQLFTIMGVKETEIEKKIEKVYKKGMYSSSTTASF